MTLRRLSPSTLMCTALVLVTFAVALGWLLPLYWFSDDYNYMQSITYSPTVNDDFWHIRFGHIPAVPDVGEIMMSCVNHWQYINSRLCNMVAIVAYHTMPRWLIEVIVSGCIGLTLPLLAQRRKPVIYAVTAALMWMVMPWHDLIQSTSFQFNYPVMALFWLLGVRRFNSQKNVGWLTLTAFFLLGLGHEGWSIVMVAYLGTLWLFNRQRPKLLMIIAATVGLLVSITNGTINRFSTMPLFNLSGHEYVHAIAPFAAWLIMVAIIVIILRKHLEKQEIAAVAVAVVVDIAISVYTTSIPRMLWPAAMLTIGLVIKAISTIRIPRPRLITVAITAVYVIWGLDLHHASVAVGANERAFAAPVMHTDIADERYLPWWLSDMVKSEFNSLRLYNVHQDMAVLRTAGTDSAVLVLPHNAASISDLRPMLGTARLRVNGPMLYADSTMRPALLRVTLGDHTPAASPVERINALRYPSPLTIDVETRHAPVHIPGHPDATLIFINLDKPPLRNRLILSIDTII